MAKKTTQTTPELAELIESHGEQTKKNNEKNYINRKKRGKRV